ncbi:MAG: SatD family protein [Eubacteriales bacterium]
MNYVALIIDIEKSKGYQTEERIVMQEFMVKCVEKLNFLFRDEMKFNVVFSAGDEIQGLFLDVTNAVIYFRLLEMLMRPIKLRAGIGIGGCTVMMEGGSSTQQDGPAYHNARKAIEEVKLMKLHSLRIHSEINKEKSGDILVNHLLNTSLPLKNQQIYMQNIAQVIYELLYPMVGNSEMLFEYDVIKELIAVKFEYRLGAKKRGEYWARNKAMEREKLEKQQLFVINPLYINGELVEPEDMIIEKNVAKTIAEVLGCSRQNVANIMRRGYVYKIRELDYVALQMAKRIYGGEEWN